MDKSGGDQDQSGTHKHKLELCKGGLKPVSVLAISAHSGVSALQKLEHSS